MTDGIRDATALAGHVRAGEVAATELVEAALRRIEQANGDLGAFVHVDGDAALARAEAAEGPLAGVPFAVKDLTAFPGMRWAMGSRLFDRNVASEHSPYTRALERAGLVTLGKTATSEFGLLGSTETLLEGSTLNPWGLGVSAGGSSGGAAAAVAAGVLPLAHASDGGGSVRVPASVCGVFGFKPSNGRCQSNLPPGGFSDLLVDHCVSRSVRDSALLLSVTERTGPDALHLPVGLVREPLDRRLRIATWPTTLLGAAPEAQVADALTAALTLCAELGHETVEANPPPVDGAAVSDAFSILAAASVDALAATVAPMLGRDVGPGELEPFTLELLDWYRGLSAGRRDSAAQALQAAADCYRSAFETADVVVTPTLATPPWPLGELAPTRGRAELISTTERIVGYTPIHNIAGCPAMSLPLHWSAEGLPIGVNVAPGADALLLAFAYELEAAQPWHDRRPRALEQVAG